MYAVLSNVCRGREGSKHTTRRDRNEARDLEHFVDLSFHSRGRRGGRPGSKFVPDARAATLGRAQGGNDAACERAKQQDYAAMVYARSRSPSFLTADGAAWRAEGRPINEIRFSPIYYYYTVVFLRYSCMIMYLLQL